ncbi:hypothetical protein NOF04DRAFT_8553 [Fusarium oxysporum II5]|uniref:Uncharacterized protein n=1 Tax=Fusarium odoratissimum (strain NRRL 54006) TaxID=1089451 RepID=X0K652_FUSO5|nr:uncharacterized protein FOIG_02031 [Fusarium odoratissimum NRRL 54006]EXM09049.1 hypothetical protein FOIG_02031 [Fusarium odoratissimum NRRL 54006]KAK2128103.1 hypothetical protein NOF04DRAFT_8553 [Fusarium oxysporum II5]
MIKSRRFAQAAWLGSQVETPWGILGWPVKLGRVDEQHEKIRTESVRYAKVVNLKIPWEISLRTRSKPPVARTHHQSTTDHGPTPGLGGHQGSGMMDPRHSSILTYQYRGPVIVGVSGPPLHTAIISWASLDHRVRILPYNAPAVCPKYFNDLDQDTQVEPEQFLLPRHSASVLDINFYHYEQRPWRISHSTAEKKPCVFRVKPSLRWTNPATAQRDA